MEMSGPSGVRAVYRDDRSACVEHGGVVTTACEVITISSARVYATRGTHPSA